MKKTIFNLNTWAFIIAILAGFAFSSCSTQCHQLVWKSSGQFSAPGFYVIRQEGNKNVYGSSKHQYKNDADCEKAREIEIEKYAKANLLPLGQKHYDKYIGDVRASYVCESCSQ